MSNTVTLTQNEQKSQEEQLVLRLRSQDTRPRVTWGAGVVDNEHMGRLKSNCCCIYTPPRRWDDPTTWEPEEHETEHCRGHTLPDKKKKEEENENEEEEKKECCDHC